MVRKKLISVGLVTCALSVLPFSGNAFAQDLLPEDNGIMGYHEAPRYRESEGHPLRLLAYALHPIGWVAREAVIRPWSSFAGSTRFNRSFFGFREPFDYRDAVCFDASGAIPDCRAVAPYNSIGSSSSPLVNGDGSGSGLMSERQVYIPDIAFDFDRSSLNALGRGRVRQVAQLLASVPDLSIAVEGHADVRGGDDYNNALGMRRAERVIKELIDLGIDPARLSPATFGEQRPIFPEGEEWAYAVNRRVQFMVQGEGEMAEEQ